MESILLDEESRQTSDDVQPESPWAVAQLGVLNNRMVPVTLFDGYTDLLNTAWNADGQPLLLYDVCFKSDSILAVLTSGFLLSTIFSIYISTINDWADQHLSTTEHHFPNFIILSLQTNLAYRQYYGYMPLFSGLSVTIDVMGTISVALFGSAAISLWNRDAKMTINSTY